MTRTRTKGSRSAGTGSAGLLARLDPAAPVLAGKALLLAAVEGVSPGQARATLAVGQRLGELPGTEAAVRRGELSGPKVGALTGAAIADSTLEGDLLAGAATEPLARVRDRGVKARADAAGADPAATIRGARLLGHLGPMATGLRRARRQAGAATEPEAALRADALVALVTGRTGGEDPVSDPDPDKPGGDRPDARSLDRPPPCSVVVRVDLEVLFGGEDPRGGTARSTASARCRPSWPGTS
ncbi:MAG TPA: hypothetical protein VG032_03200 [Acidimicrobiales bacterium]|jgi:hypothetical protein|nr:hypothetical protein [Acidimicrobiales bacterium]